MKSFECRNVVSLRQFANNAYNHHHGIQTTERFGVGTDADGDGFVNEMTRGDVTAVTIWQATLQVPGRVNIVEFQIGVCRDINHLVVSKLEARLRESWISQVHP
jgi:hypothetical protein